MDEEQEDWDLLSRRCLEYSFGDDEPEYSLDLIKDPNPDYAGGWPPQSLMQFSPNKAL